MNETSLIGRTLAGKFEITGHIGEGGMATVYRGTWDGDPPTVALKVMNPELARDRKFVRRFRREAKAAAMLKHPNTVTIVEFGVDGEQVYLAMECLEGQDLSYLLHRDRRIPEARAARILIQVCAALGEAHRQNIVHRDLKPDNVMLIDDDGQERVKVLDFGIAKILDDAGDDSKVLDPRAEPASSSRSLLTRVGTIVGTPAYMSPEQGRAEAVDARTDLYSCGVLLFELLTGRVPFDGETPMQVVMRHVNEPPMPPGQLVPMHAGLEALIMKALAKFAAQRHQSADEMAKELEALLPELATERRARQHESAKVQLSGTAAQAAQPGPAPAPAARTVPTAQPAPTAQPVPAAPAAPARAQPAAWAQPLPPGPELDDDDDDAPTGIVNLPPVPPRAGAARPAAFPTLELGLTDDLPDIPLPGAPIEGSGVAATEVQPPAPRTGAAPVRPGRATPSTLTKPNRHPLEATQASAEAKPPARSPAPPSVDDDDDDDEARTLIADPKPPDAVPRTAPAPRAASPAPLRPTPPVGRGPLAPPEGTPTGTIPVGGARPPAAALAGAPPAPPAPLLPPTATKPITVPGKGGHPFADTIASAAAPAEAPPQAPPKLALGSDKTEPSKPASELVGNLIASELGADLASGGPSLNLPPVPQSPTGTIPVGTSKADLGIGKPIVVDHTAKALESTQRVPTELSNENKKDAASIQLKNALPTGTPETFSQQPKVQVETLAAQLPKGSPRAPTEVRAKPPPALWQPRKVKARPRWMAPVAVVLGVMIGAILFATVIFVVNRLGP